MGQRFDYVEMHKAWLAGTCVSLNPQTLRKYLIEDRGYRCQKCGLKEWNGSPIPLDVEHNDGNSDNDSVENTQLLCLNCHGLTPTYKTRNIGKGRHFRRVRYQEGKSF